MKKYLLIVLISSLCIANAASLVKAKDARAITNKETRKLEKKLLTSPNGKKAYNGLIRFFNKKISTIASGGYYDSLTITFMNAPKEIATLLKPLNRQEQDMMRSLIIKKLQQNGYKITYNKFWDNPGNFNISISW
ncbi:hypothetical protein [Sulfurimonas sp. NWX79]|uniref:hypothetical protein n=1 Tax=Sulfurimonas sp. NWX79 TaxID=2925412 RepID=UPI003204C5F6